MGAPAVQVNRIRQSLQLIARNSSAFGLVQPHLERTRLCQLPDSQLDPKYLRQRADLHDLVLGLAHPKVAEGHSVTAAEKRPSAGLKSSVPPVTK